MLLMYRRKSVGEMTPPCGTPSLIVTLSLLRIFLRKQLPPHAISIAANIDEDCKIRKRSVLLTTDTR